MEVIPSDFWVMKYIWDTEEQIEILAGIIDGVIGKEISPQSHPQALFNKVPNSEELVKEVLILTEKWDNGGLTFEEQNVIKDKLRYVQNRSGWIKNQEHRQHIEQKIETLWHKILQTI
jgi:MoxR-like ATPase